jgi:hypothetical protein
MKLKKTRLAAVIVAMPLEYLLLISFVPKDMPTPAEMASRQATKCCHRGLEHEQPIPLYDHILEGSAQAQFVPKGIKESA